MKLQCINNIDALTPDIHVASLKAQKLPDLKFPNSRLIPGPFLCFSMQVRKIGKARSILCVEIYYGIGQDTRLH